MKKLFLLIWVLSFFFFPSIGYTQETWKVTDFKSDIAIQKTGRVLIHETISVDFGSLEIHGIYRDIPYVYRQSDGKQYYTEISVSQTKRNGKNEPFTISQNETYIRIRLGDKDKIINGKHVYEIIYEVSGILLPYDRYDELYWNVTGNDWEVPLEHVSATVTLPDGKILQAACYQGIEGSTEQCPIQKETTVAQFSSNGSLFAGSGMTIAVGFPKGTVPLLTIAKPLSFWDKLFSPLALAFFAIPSLLGIGAIIYRWFTSGRDFWGRNIPFTDRNAKGEIMPIGAKESIVVEFTSPNNLRPAEVGVLMDERADTLDITATIIDLAIQGFLTIEEVKKKWLFGSTDYILHKKKNDASSLLDYEKTLLTRLFEKGDDITLSSLKTTFYDDLKIVKNKLYNETVAKQFFIDNPEKIRTRYLILGIVIAGISLTLAFIAATSLANPYLFTLGSGMGIVGTFLSGFSFVMPRRSSVGRDLYRRSRGFKKFIDGAEQYRQQFYEKKNLFHELLPYAIVFGLTEKFARAMRDLGVKQTQPTWYMGSQPFSPTLFGSHVNTFSKTLSSAMIATPKSSGSGGGGFSGGGFGGGGGGSW